MIFCTLQYFSGLMNLLTKWIKNSMNKDDLVEILQKNLRFCSAQHIRYTQRLGCCSKILISLNAYDHLNRLLKQWLEPQCIFPVENKIHCTIKVNDPAWHIQLYLSGYDWLRETQSLMEISFIQSTQNTTTSFYIWQTRFSPWHLTDAATRTHKECNCEDSYSTMMKALF